MTEHRFLCLLTSSVSPLEKCLFILLIFIPAVGFVLSFPTFKSELVLLISLVKPEVINEGVSCELRWLSGLCAHEME